MLAICILDKPCNTGACGFGTWNRLISPFVNRVVLKEVVICHLVQVTSMKVIAHYQVVVVWYFFMLVVLVIN